MGSIPGTGRYIVARMITENEGPLSLGPIPSGRLKNLTDIDKWSSLSLYLLVRGMLVTSFIDWSQSSYKVINILNIIV